MRLVGKIGWGLGVAAAVYFCVSLLLTSFGRGNPRKDRAQAREENLSQVERTEPLSQTLPQPIADKPRAAAPSVSVLVREQQPAEHSEPDKTAELASTLEGQYAVDARPTRESATREKTLKNLFLQPELDGKGHLEEVDCRGTICRGVIKIANRQADGEVFSRTFLSQQYMSSIQDAVTVASRQTLPDGTIVATFYIHPQSVFQMVAP